MIKPLAAALCALALTTATPMARAIEEPRYTVVAQHEGFEVRDYAPTIVAEVTVPGPAGEAGSQGFRKLAGYIFGGNRGERKIAMTAPVTQSAAPQRIEMTAPVKRAASDGGFLVRFTMPSEFTMDTLPEPLDPAVRLTEVPGGRFAVIRYSGTWSEGNDREHLTALKAAMAAVGLQPAGEPVYARYDPPWIPWFARRNEIWLPLA